MVRDGVCGVTNTRSHHVGNGDAKSVAYGPYMLKEFPKFERNSFLENSCRHVTSGSNRGNSQASVGLVLQC
jgi:hypothetical protein